VKQNQLHAQLVRLNEWIDEYIAILEADFEKDAEGFPILPKGADGDAPRVLQNASRTLTRIISRVGNEQIEGDPELPLPGDYP